MKNATTTGKRHHGSYLLKISAVMVLLAMSFTANKISAQNTEEDGLKTIYHIYNQGDYIGALPDMEPVEVLIEEKVEDMSGDFDGLDLQASGDLEVLAEQVFEPAAGDGEEIISQLDDDLAIKAKSFALAVDGETAVYLKDREAYNETLRQLKLAYVSPEELDEWEQRNDSKESLPELEPGQTRLLDLSISEKISGLTKQAEPEKVMTAEEAVDTLLEEEKVTVQVKREEKVEEGIGFETVHKDDDGLFIGKSKEEQSGEKGTKQLTYEIQEENGERTGRHITDEHVSKEPVEEIILEGTKELPTKGTGKFAWPADGGYISSERGKRWGRLHNGIDIARPDSLDILSADHGVVKAAGAAGTFGNRVVVDHQNGYETIYAHLSSIDVKVGDKVPKGTKLGVMGTTGRSTGIHLHFEISLDGNTKNPLDYIK